ncbi:DNA cytosine methyltransferase [Jiangella asiatica]|uniref:DNA cytosine methyltransferase n=1 Tax=Jiangella asiatica TaxID=2530372 RepID=A0A4R5CY25_9ACTN|nr:DNA cytosine methyltransferase [Jiangella asiatica]TDE03444.1 DNA cytosine methyltransferase [Jiangella asiatica]
MSRPRLLDLFCGAGGCSVGYSRAGFDVTGVDIEPHDDYPYDLIVSDAMRVLLGVDFLSEFDVVHASPPCQAKTTMSNRYRGKGGRTDEHINLIAPVRDLLLTWGGLYVIENVPGARFDLREPITLHGGMFELGVDRPRLFESNAPLMLAPAPATRNPLGVYGARPDGRRLWTRADGTEQRAAASIEAAGAAMGIDWMTDFRDIAEAIPPAYTECIGGQLLDYLERAA